MKNESSRDLLESLPKANQVRDLLESLPKANQVRDRIKINQKERSVLRRLYKLALEAESMSPQIDLS